MAHYTYRKHVQRFTMALSLVQCQGYGSFFLKQSKLRVLCQLLASFWIRLCPDCCAKFKYNALLSMKSMHLLSSFIPFQSSWNGNQHFFIFFVLITQINRLVGSHRLKQQKRHCYYWQCACVPTSANFQLECFYKWNF